MNLQLALLPAFPTLTSHLVGLALSKGTLEWRQPKRSASEKRCLYEITSVHVYMNYINDAL